jgi:uncharacterized protein
MRADPSAWTLIVFARAPVAGQAKSRLVPALGAEGAAGLQRVLMRLALQRALAARGARVELWLAGAADEPLRRELQDLGIADRFEQRGADLGRRMAHAVDHAFARTGAPCVLIGTDCPAQTTADLEQAAAALAAHDVVLQPAVDGGYVLIGMRRPRPALFDSIDWGGDQVCAQTRARAERQCASLLQLRTLPDLDTEADLKLAIERGWLPR